MSCFTHRDPANGRSTSSTSGCTTSARAALMAPSARYWLPWECTPIPADGPRRLRHAAVRRRPGIQVPAGSTTTATPSSPTSPESARHRRVPATPGRWQSHDASGNPASPPAAGTRPDHARLPHGPIAQRHARRGVRPDRRLTTIANSARRDQRHLRAAAGPGLLLHPRGSVPALRRWRLVSARAAASRSPMPSHG